MAKKRNSYKGKKTTSKKKKKVLKNLNLISVKI